MAPGFKGTWVTPVVFRLGKGGERHPVGVRAGSYVAGHRGPERRGGRRNAGRSESNALQPVQGRAPR